MASAAEQTTKQTSGSHGLGGIHRDDQYWYNTGDIVLVANHQVAFKVYIGLLTKESTVFRDLVNKDLPQPENQELFDNCPVIHLTDNPQDLKTFLAFIYDGWRFRRDNEHTKWPAVRVMIMLGDKYDAPEIYTEGAELLKLALPKYVPVCDQVKPMDYTPEDVMSIAFITRNMDTDLHAVALYHCCLLPISTLISGLPSEVLHRCLRGREGLPMIRLDALRLFFKTRLPEASCRQLGCSWTSIGDSYALTEYSRMYLTKDSMTYDILQVATWDNIIAVIKKNGLCENCQQTCKRKAWAIRQRFRNKLVELFSDENPGKIDMFS